MPMPIIEARYVAPFRHWIARTLGEPLTFYGFGWTEDQAVRALIAQMEAGHG